MQRVAAVDIYAFGGTENDDLRGQIVLAAAVRLPAGKNRRRRRNNPSYNSAARRQGPLKETLIVSSSTVTSTPSGRFLSTKRVDGTANVRVAMSRKRNETATSVSPETFSMPAGITMRSYLMPLLAERRFVQLDADFMERVDALGRSADAHGLDRKLDESVVRAHHAADEIDLQRHVLLLISGHAHLDVAVNQVDIRVIDLLAVFVIQLHLRDGRDRRLNRAERDGRVGARNGVDLALRSFDGDGFGRVGRAGRAAGRWSAHNRSARRPARFRRSRCGRRKYTRCRSKARRAGCRWAGQPGCARARGRFRSARKYRYTPGCRRWKGG